MKIKGLIEKVKGAEAKAWMEGQKETAKLLHELDRNLEAIVEHMHWIERGLENAKQGQFNELGNLQSSAQQFDIAVAKAATLLRLLPSEVQEELTGGE